jgi:catechol 2,3-dioxygenase-like lactoylglutathione lyase family enzyme
MVKLDHLTIFVSDEQRSRDWYVSHFGFRVEFEVPERNTVALQEDGDLTLFLVREPINTSRPSCILTLQVVDVDATCRDLAARGVHIEKPPQKLEWGYGAELRDPDGYGVHLWDEKSMREKGGP